MSALLKVNVNDHTEKKNGLTYLSWAWAWAEALQHDPQATWEAAEFNGFPAAFGPDGSAMVKVTVTLKGHAKTCWLPVMDHRNKAIKNPDAFAVNTAIVRCLVKALAVHGLGLYIYAGEDLPEVAEQTFKSAPQLAWESVDPEQQHRLEQVAKSVLDAMPDASRALDIIDGEELDADQKSALWSRLDSKTRAAIKKAAE